MTTPITAAELDGLERDHAQALKVERLPYCVVRILVRLPALLAAARRGVEADAKLALVYEWTHTYGSDLKPTGADTYGEGVRHCKDAVRAILNTEPPR